MAPVEWDSVMKAKPSSLSEEDADTFYDMLKEAEVDSETDTLRLRQIFKLVQQVMVNRNNMVEESMNMADSEAKEAKKKELELKNEQERLQKELSELKRIGADGGGGGGVAANVSRLLRDTIRTLEVENGDLKKEVNDTNILLNTEKREAEKYVARSSELEKELKELRVERDQLLQDLDSFKMQLQTQSEKITSHQGDDMGFRDKLARKNHELAEAMEELQNLTDSNERLQHECDVLQKNLTDAVQQIDSTREDYMKLKAVLQQSDSVTDRLRGENEILKAQVQDLTEQVQSKSESDDAIMVAVNSKIEEWQTVVGGKDQQIAELQEQIFRLRDQLTAANMDSDKASITALTQVLKEKDQQIEELTAQTNQYVNEMEASAALVEDLRAELSRAGAGGGDRLQNKIRDLQKDLGNAKQQLKDADQDRKKAEDDAKAKDKELNEALERMQAYEKGEYGLEEAVMEIKEKKTQINVRDRQIEELTQYINGAEVKINEVLDENEELRYRLGMDPREPLDLTQLRNNKAIRHEEEKALNFVLQRQIEQLEEERVNDKQKIRKLGKQLGKRAVELGLTAEDMVAVQDFTETLKVQRQTTQQSYSAATIIKREVQKQESSIRNHELDKDYKQNLVELTQMEREVAQYKTQCTQLSEENSRLEGALQEVMEALQKQGAQQAATPRDPSGELEVQVGQFPAIERMLAAIEAKRVIGNYDTSLYLKEQVDVLRGRHEEIRAQLREARVESSKMALERDKAFQQLEKIQKQGMMLEDEGLGGMSMGGGGGGGGGRGWGAGVMAPVAVLPEGMAPTSAEVIASLNEHLVIVLQELSQRQETMQGMEKSLESYKRKFAVVRHQQGLLYKDYLRDKQEWDNEKEQLTTKLKAIEGNREEDLVKIGEFDRLVDTLKQDDVEVRRRLSEMTRRMTVLRVNEKALVRRHNTLEEMEGTLRKENNRLRNEMSQMESAISERMGYLQRYKDLASFKIAALQRAVEESVPQQDLDKVNKEYHQLTEKYRDLLEKGNTLVTKAEAISGLESEIQQLTAENEELKSTLKVDKERLHVLEATMEDLTKKGVGGGGEVGVTSAEVVSISRKLTMLEMKELNERQRADHAVRMYDQQRQLITDLENRVRDLDDKFAEITKMNLEMQKTERDLRDELANSVTKEASDAERKRIAELEETELNLRNEISKLKDTADVASAQVRTLELQHVSHEKENKSLRQQLLDFQVQSDEKTLVGKLHRTMVQLQISESTAVKQLESSRKRVTQLEAAVLRLEQKVDSKEQSLFHTRHQTQSKVRYLKRSLQEVRLQFAGAVPLSRQEKFSKSMVQLQQDKASLEQQLREVRKQREETEDQVAALSLQREGLQELISTLKDGRGASKVAEWHSKMDGLRLEELKQRRNNAKLHQQIKYLEEIIRSHEVSISELEADNVRLLKEFEERQMRWEHRETELERNIITMERQTAEITGAAARFEQAIGSLPDSQLPVANQLEQAITTIKTNVKVILDTQAENKALKAKMQELQKILKDSERTLIEREKIIAELRLRMPATSERDTIIERVSANVAKTMAQAPGDGGSGGSGGGGGGAGDESDYGAQQGLKIAQSTVHSLQQRIQQKEETVLKYQDLLKGARQEMLELNRRHEQELKTMQAKLHQSSDLAFTKFKQAAHDLIAQQAATPHRSHVSEKQLERLSELEDTVAEQENTISALQTKVKEKEEEVIRLRAQIATAEKHSKRERSKLHQERTDLVSRKDTEVDDLHRTVADQKKEIVVLNEEIAALKDSQQRGPSASMKNLVDRLKNQLALKEKQHQALSKALTDLRADMVAQAQNSVISQAEDAQQERNIQRLIDSHTKDISEQLEETQSQLERTKRELKKRKETEGLLQTELEDVKEELGRKDRANNKLRNSKTKLETEVDELEKKVEKLSASKAQKTGDFERMQELEDMRRRNKYLEEEMKKRTMAEKPYEQKEDKAKLEEALRWEEGKKWQRTIDKMKTKIKEKDEEIEKLSRSVERLKATLDRTTREKDALESRSRGPLVQKATVSSLSAAPPSSLPHPPAPRSIDHDKEDLRQINFKLEEEIRSLKKQAVMSQDAAFKEVQMRNSHLREQVEQLERALAHRPKEGGVEVKEYQRVFEKNQELQREVLRLSEENMELRFEVEAARKDVPRMKDRITELQKYNEALKQENSTLSGDSARSAASSIRRLGDSGKSTRELERTIALLKKVVERVQQENERLKKAPGVVSSEQMALLKKENEGLKNQMEDLRQHMGVTLSERYTSQQKGTAKMMTDHERMRKELAKEKETNEKLRIEIRNLELRGEQGERELRETKGRLEIEAAKRPSANSMAQDQSSWKAAVQTRMYEERIRGLEEDNDKKTKQMSDMKTLLRDAADREQSLMKEKEQLMQQIAVLERFPAGSQVTDASIMRDYQQARLQIDRLENEKKELVNDLRLAEKHSTGGDQMSPDIMMKARKYEEMSRENVEHRLEVKAAQLEKQKLQVEVDRLKHELESFGPDFFEEIEDLKFNYKQSVERCVLVEDKLRTLARQFGVSVGIPGFN